MQLLTVVMTCDYIDEFEVINDHQAGKITVNLTGRLNKCGVISPTVDSVIFIVLATIASIKDHEEV
ncbi:hypothetical protein A6R68_23434, partial [Neotoma lepida]